MVFHIPNIITADRPSFKLYNGDRYGVDKLDPILTSNGTAITPVFRYKSGDADAVDWAAWDYGETLDLIGSGEPSYNQGSPLLGSNDDSVKFNDGKFYTADNNDFADIDTEDLVIEVVFKSPLQGYNYIFQKEVSSHGWFILTGILGELQFRWYDGYYYTTTSDTLDPDSWYHALLFTNKDENSTNASQWYINGTASGSGVNLSFAGSATAAKPLWIGISSNTSIAYAAMWKQSGWHAAGASGPAEWANIAAERFAKLTGTYPNKANGTALPITATRSSSAYLDKIESGNRVIYPVGDNWMRMVDRNDDANNENIKGLLSEKASNNLLTYSEDFTRWIAIDERDGYLANSCVTPNKETDGYGIVADAYEGPHGVQKDINLAYGTHYLSVWAKPGNKDHLILDEDGYWNVLFNLSNGTVQQETYSTGYIENWGNMFRCCAEFDTINDDIEHTLRIRSSDDDGYFVGDGVTINTHIWGAQLEDAYCMSSYIKTTDSIASRSADLLQYKMDDGNIGSALDKRGTINYNFLTNDCNNDPDKWLVTLRDSYESFDEIMGMYLDRYCNMYVETGGSSNSVSSSTIVADGYIHALRSTYSSEAYRLYIDETQEGGNVPPDIPIIDEMTVGNHSILDSQLNGTIGDLVIYPRVLGSNIAPLLVNDQTTPSQTTIYITVSAGNTVILYWGDGTSEVLTADGTLHAYQHTYSAGTYIISVDSDIAGITDWRSYLQSFLSGDVGRFNALSGLTQLHLYNTSVSGDVGGLSGLTSMTQLQLQGTSVSGDIAGLSSLTSMTQLYLYSTSVSGDIGDLSSLTGLTVLYLSSTSVYGDVSDLSSLTSLTQLYLNSTSVSGDIGGLSSITGLTVLYLNSTSVSGNIGGLSSLTGLTLLNLNNTSVSGNISALSGLTSMGQLHLNSTSVSGDISALSGLTSIGQLYLINTSVSGNISALSGLTSMGQLYLNSTSVSGNISALSGLTSMGQLYLNSTSVSGDISALSGLTSLTYLNLINTSVSGNISALSGLTSLTDLYITNTSVSGDISALSGLTSLKYLWLYSTSVSGDISALSGLTSLAQIRLYSTSVSGDIGDLNGLISLTYLWLYSTSLSYGSVALPPWTGNNIQIHNTGLDSTEVDNFLIDLANGVGANGTLNIAGTNAARTSASDAAKATLLAAGWTVTVNE